MVMITVALYSHISLHGQPSAVQRVRVAELSLYQVTFVPAVNCTFVGLREPEYLLPPIVMKS